MSGREIARRIQMAEADMTDLPPGMEKPTGIPVAYLVAPQAWAWRKGRVAVMRYRRVDVPGG